MNKRGFAYLLAIPMLALLAFMGMFLLQSSTTEYSQAAMSVHRTMARQLAESATEEAFIMLEERFRDKTNTGYLEQLLWQASNSEIPVGGGTTGLNPTLLHDFTDLKDRVTQTITIKDYHITRAGFAIEKVLPSIKDLRPIDQGPLNYPANYYHPPDRSEKFDNAFSRSWYLTLQVDVIVSTKNKPNFRLAFTASRDMKLINMAPIARNYTLFSILGHRMPVGSAEQVKAVLHQEMNSPDTPGGRLILWNQPFQSRVYLHGPSIVALENPELALDPESKGSYNVGDPTQSKPGINQAYQYYDTFFGLSYYPSMGRAIFPPKTLWDSLTVWWRGGKPSKDDAGGNKTYYPGVLENATVYGGLLPHKGRDLLELLGGVSSQNIQDTYFRGTNVTQKFLPAGLYCRTPSKYFSQTLMKEDRYLPNRIDDFSNASKKRFPADDDKIIIEHRWLQDDPTVSEESKIYASVNEVKYNVLTNSVTPTPKLLEFATSYYNDPDPETFVGKLGYSFASIGSAFWQTFTKPFQMLGALVSPLISGIFGNDDGVAVGVGAEQKFPNLFPTNFNFNFRALATRSLSQAEFEAIVRDPSTGDWHLSGVYLLDSFQLDAPVTYIGTGTIMVSDYDSTKPFRIRGSIVSAKAADGVTPLGHLNIFYHPYDPMAMDISDRLINIEGTGIVIEASVYSCYGIKTNDGDIYDFTLVGIFPHQSMEQWDPNFVLNLVNQTNMIYGNYVNFYMNKNYQKGDLWVMHNVNSPVYFNKVGGNSYSIVQTDIDATPEGRKKYELMTHECFMSPRLQHVGTFGAGQ